jgi:hypothetical protein
VGFRKLLTEYIAFLVHSKKWWMVPLVVAVFVALVLFCVAQSSVVLPYIYALF